MVKVLVDSRFRISGTHARYKFTIPFPINNVRSMRLIYANFPKTSYPVELGFNDQIDFDYNATSFIATLTSGRNYSGSQLAAELKTQLDSASSTTDFTVVYDANTNKLQVTTVLQDFFFEAQIATPAVRFVLGLVDPTAANAASKDFTLPNMVDLSHPKYHIIDVITGNSGHNSLFTAGNTHSFFVPMYKDFLEFSEFDSLGQFLQSDINSNNPIQEMDIQIFNGDAESQFDPSGIPHQLLFEFL